MKPEKKGLKKGKAIKKKAKKDPNEPPRPVSAYASFFRDTQAAIKGQNPNATFGEVSKIVASMWDSLDFNRKRDYKDKADAAKKEYMKALTAYRASKAALEGSDVMDLDPSLEEMQDNSASSPVAPSSPTTSEPEIIKTAAVTNPEADNEIDEEAQNENDLEVIEEPDDNSEEQNITEESIDVSKSSKAEGECNISNTKEIKESEQNGPHMVNGTTEPINEPLLPMCSRSGCPNRAVVSPEWDKEYCSSECVIEHCNAAFLAHREARQKRAATEIKV